MTDSFSKSPMKPKICETASSYFSKVIAGERAIDLVAGHVSCAALLKSELSHGMK